MEEHFEILNYLAHQSVECIQSNFDDYMNPINDDYYRSIHSLWEEYYVLHGERTIVNRIFVNTPHSGNLSKIGFILADSVKECFICGNEVNKKERKRNNFYDILSWSEPSSQSLEDVNSVHCHACGNIVCGKCADYGYIIGYEDETEVPMCRQCYWGQVSDISINNK